MGAWRQAFWRSATRLLVAAIAFMTLQACVIPFDKQWVHTPPLATNVAKVVKGQTTRGDVLRMFGPPDIEADGPTAKANDSLPRFRMLTETGAKVGIRVDHRSASPVPYSSIDDDHVLFVYIEEAHRGTVVLPGPSWGSMRRNVLLIFMQKKTGLVDELTYREEFKAP